MKAESEGDAIGAAYFANLSARAAQRAASLSSAVSVLVGKAEALASEREQGEPAITVAGRSGAAEMREKRELELSETVNRSARFLVTRDRMVIATFLREEDAFLLESELAELDRERGVETGTCEILDRQTGHRLGGYMMANGKMLVFVRDDEHEARFGRRRH